MAESVCCIDFGTTALKAALVDNGGRITAASACPVPPVRQWHGFQTVDPDACVRAAFEVVRAAVEEGRGKAGDVVAVALSTQRATVLVTDSIGRALTPAICWYDSSCGEEVRELAAGFGAWRFRALTGFAPSFVLSINKLLRLRRLLPDYFRSANRISLFQDYALHRLGAPGFFCDATNGAATGMFDLRAGTWAAALLDVLELNAAQVPQVCPCTAAVGALGAAAARATGLREGTPLVVGGGDQQCVTAALGGLHAGDVSLCLGTAGVLNCVVPAPVVDGDSAMYCLPHLAPGAWIQEGYHASFGSSLDWAARLLRCRSASGVERLAAHSRPGANGARCLTFLAGSGTPDYDADATGCFEGLRLGTTRYDLARSVVEGLCFELRRIVDTRDGPLGTRRVLLSGNAFRGRATLQMLSDVLGVPLCASANRDLALTGAAALAWVGAGRWASLWDVYETWEPQWNRQYAPGENRGVYESLYRDYCRRVTEGGTPAVRQKPESGQQTDRGRHG